MSKKRIAKAGKSRQQSVALEEAVPIAAPFSLMSHIQGGPAWRCYAVLAGATIVCLLPFVGKAFHIDDTLFLYSARQIVKHPFDPFGFEMVWNETAERMSDITKNPPLACYYAALIGRSAGWSEHALHFGFLLPALALILGTYRLAFHLTNWPLLAAIITLCSPGILVSATSVMCDTMMLALWTWAVVLWIEGLEPRKPWLLIASSGLIALSALAKYFGAALIPLLFVYSLVRLKRFGSWAAYFAIPCFVSLSYEVWTASLYGQGLLASAAEFAGTQRAAQQGATAAHALVDLSFAGGCTIPVLMLAPLLWSWRKILFAVGAGMLCAFAPLLGWVNLGTRASSPLAAQLFREQWLLVTGQLALCIVAGLLILVLTIEDICRHSDTGRWLLGLWVIGTFFFAGFLNWTVNARSVLPLIPAAAILMARRLERGEIAVRRGLSNMLVCGLTASALLSLWVSASDAAWANSVRNAAAEIREKTQNEKGSVFFAGHWGFQYYMENFGFKPIDPLNSYFHEGDLLVIDKSGPGEQNAPPGYQTEPAQQSLMHHPNQLLATMDPAVCAGFYSSFWGPLPFAFGSLYPEEYAFERLVLATQPPPSR